MSLFVDHVGLNTLISEEITGSTNTRGPIVNRDTTRDSSLGVAASTSNNPSLVATGLTGYPTTGQLGFSFWINLDNDSTATKYIMYAANASSYSNQLYLFNNRIYFTAKDSSSSKSWNYALTAASLVGTWKHIYISWTGNFLSDPDVYVNAVSLGLPTVAGSATGPNRLAPDGIRLFDHPLSDPAYELQGTLQSFAIFSGLAGPTGVAASSLYNSGVPKNSAPLYSSNMLDFWLLGNEPQFYSTQTGESIGSGTTLLSSGGTIGTNLTSSTSEVILRDGLTTDSPVSTLSTGFVGSVSSTNQLVALNTHRNGPYGYSTWKQLRVSENPITRYHNKNSTLTFVTQPGPVINLGQNGELRIRSRYSALYNYTEPAIAQKSHPLIWNVGRHFKDEDGNVDLDNPQKFSIISSYGNQQIGFANEQVDKLLKFDPDEEQTEYVAISAMYLENGLNKQDSPLTYWEFLQYRETVYPHMKNQFQNENLERPTFESFFRHKRTNRTTTVTTSSMGYEPGVGARIQVLSQSTWPLDEHEKFQTRSYTTNSSSVQFNQDGEPAYPSNLASYQRNGEGNLMQTISQYSHFLEGLSATNELNDPDPATAQDAAADIDGRMGPGALYMRRISLANSASVSNPSGMEIYGTGSELKLFQGGALWETGPKRYIKDDTGNYVSAPRLPFYDTYEDYIEEARRKHKNFSVIPEFRMSTQVEDYRRTNNAIELDMFDVTGGVSGTTDSSDDDFYEIYSNSDFMRNFEVVSDDHKDFTNGKVLSLRCKAVKKFLPYEGFYPAQRTTDLTKQFYDSFKEHIKLKNGNNVEINDFNYGRQLVMTPLFAPGVLFNTIKSGVAVDYPIITGSIVPDEITVNGVAGYYIYNNDFDKRIPFEALVEPHRYLAGYDITSNEPHPSGNLSASANWDGVGDELYGLMMNNFLAEVPEFFLPDGELTSVVSKKQGDIALVSGSVYGMRVKMKRSMDKTRGSVYHSASSDLPYYPPQDVGSGSYARENFTMYSRPSAFGPPSAGFSIWAEDGAARELFNFDDNNFEVLETDATGDSLIGGSSMGQNFPFTPPYYHGEAWCDITVTASSDKMTISELQAAAEYDFTRFDNTFYQFSGSNNGIQTAADLVGGNVGPQTLQTLDRNAVQLSASLNLKGIGRTRDAIRRSRDQDLVVDTALDEADRWIIQTKFETPMLNFAHVSGSDHLTLPDYGSGSVPRGIWHQHGRIPEENEGVFLEVGPIERNYWTQARGETVELQDLSEALGFSGAPTKIGRIASSKKISECVVAVPFIEKEGGKKFFRLALSEEQLEQYKSGDKQPLVTGEPQSQIGRSVLLQLDKMEKFVFPPSFDFLRFPDVDPIAMYAFEFSHTLSQQDLSDIWQNLPPEIGSTMEVSEVAITHPLLQKELLGQGGEEGNQLIDMPDKLKWMVFKVKQRAATNYFKKTVLRNPEVNTAVNDSNTTKDEFGDTSPIQYNWPYDFFSLVELVKIDAEVELGNFDKDEINNYIDNLPGWQGQTADRDKIEYIVGGMEDDPIPEVQIPDAPAKTGKTTSSDRVENQGRRSLLNREGIFDIPGNIPPSDGQAYVQLKGRFTVEANIDPLASIQSLQGKATNELLALGVGVLNLSSVTEQSFFTWSQKWYNTDSGFQQKKQQAQAGAATAEGLNNQTAVAQFEREVLRFIRAKYREYDTALRSKNRAKAKAFNDMKVRYSGDAMYSNELEIRAYNSIDTGGNAGVTVE